MCYQLSQADLPVLRTLKSVENAQQTVRKYFNIVRLDISIPHELCDVLIEAHADRPLLLDVNVAEHFHNAHSGGESCTIDHWRKPEYYLATRGKQSAAQSLSIRV